MSGRAGVGRKRSTSVTLHVVGLLVQEPEVFAGGGVVVLLPPPTALRNVEVCE